MLPPDDALVQAVERQRTDGEDADGPQGATLVMDSRYAWCCSFDESGIGCDRHGPGWVTA